MLEEKRFDRFWSGLIWFCLLFLPLCLVQCSSDSKQAGNDPNGGDEDVAEQEESSETSELPAIQPPELPRMKDWDCPEGWNSVPAFVDEDGNENPPEGMEQYSICECASSAEIGHLGVVLNVRAVEPGL